MNKHIWFAALLGLGTYSFQANAATVSAGGVLLKSPGAKPMALAEAYTAVGSDVGGVSAVHYNPAAPAFLTRGETTVLGQNGMADDAYGAFTAGFPGRFGAFTAGAAYYTAGDITLIDPQGRVRSANAQRDLTASLGHSVRMGHRLALGLRGKFIRSKLVDAVEAQAFAMDAGAQYRFGRLTFGLAAQNVGQSLRYGSTDESLPQTMRGGAAWQLNWGSGERTGRLLLSFDAVSVRNGPLQNQAGMEYLWDGVLALRGGAPIGSSSEKFVVGVGLRLGRMELDYDRLNTDDPSGSHAFSATFRFGASIED